MKIILTISVFYFSCFLLSQGNEENTNLNNYAEPVPASEKVTIEKKEDRYRKSKDVFSSVNQNSRYSYEFTRKKFKRANKTKGFSTAQQEELDGLIFSLKKSSEDSFEYNYLKYVNGNFDISLFKYLEKAYEIKSYDASLYDDFIAYYEITNNLTKKAEFTKKLMASRVIETGVYKYNENVLRSVEKNGILIVNAYDDTYPIWVLQNEKGVRKDVKLIALDLFQNKDYKKRILKKHGLKDPNVGPDNIEFITKLCTMNPGSPIYLGYTVPKYTLKKLALSLKNTGLALKYSSKKLNVDQLKINFESKLNLDYLLENQSSKKVKNLNANYLVSLVQMYQKYKGDLKKQEYIKKIALKVARDINKEELIKKSLGL